MWALGDFARLCSYSGRLQHTLQRGVISASGATPGSFSHDFIIHATPSDGREVDSMFGAASAVRGVHGAGQLGVGTRFCDVVSILDSHISNTPSVKVGHGHHCFAVRATGLLNLQDQECLYRADSRSLSGRNKSTLFLLTYLER